MVSPPAWRPPSATFVTSPMHMLASRQPGPQELDRMMQGICAGHACSCGTQWSGGWQQPWADPAQTVKVKLNSQVQCAAAQHISNIYHHCHASTAMLKLHLADQHGPDRSSNIRYGIPQTAHHVSYSTTPECSLGVSASMQSEHASIDVCVDSVCVFTHAQLCTFGPLMRRALMVHEVTYEPSSRLKKSRKAVVLITGADLVLVKMTKSTSTARSTTHSASLAEDVSGLAGAPGSSTSAGSATAGPAGMSRAASRADSGLDAAAMVADARASVLAQHELNKVWPGPLGTAAAHAQQQAQQCGL